ncbi:hypothetical protein HETIRDRAFT_172447 [Heterobasidion irregulare TC 32-1]|uniref:Uncharacterized protein n=1 Tax=Heterobasidion irregulare (strain TC 32-1) TaxID=747525 RepID=W4JZ80_HETIT|nr:uncharacterized protein HETIRDRAFT_172447 [Heterobasidion irregulare TC 32-1]ETW78878.1 hypothetical protein HETIRDRAFT_172447 [Heterobasidion irregulare TC 32-1]
MFFFSQRNLFSILSLHDITFSIVCCYSDLSFFPLSSSLSYFSIILDSIFLHAIFSYKPAHFYPSIYSLALHLSIIFH